MLQATDQSYDFMQGPIDFQPRITIPVESLPSWLFNLNRSAIKLDVFLKIFPKSLIIWIVQCTNQRLEKLGQTIHPTDTYKIMFVFRCMLAMSYDKVPKNSPIIGHLILLWETLQ
ncbi:piggyBac transposable element-derived protein 4 [Trichonephila clavata]|uniref:PiggyBac transposable element-derived protein 4 n=1 Tax=Trichonephila clavata TaxID=2740835 RepID=A0A8X6F9E0_TRICU|nr:piggyBac transposable element-derived protein 4 [Trichonephila clavata]